MTALALRQPAADTAEDVAAPIPEEFRLESGDPLPDTHVRLRRFGNADAPQIIAMGGISADRDVCGESGWWRETILDHRAIDLSRYGVIGLDFAPIADRRARITPRDQARLLIIALDRLELTALHAVVAASYGGLVGLALSALAPDRVERLVVISAAHRQSAQSLAFRGVQRRIVEFGARRDEALEGLALARQLAMITYRTGAEFETRFGAGIDAEGKGAVDRYLENRGEAYTSVASPNRWLALSEAIDRARIDPAHARAPTTLIACTDDQLVPISLMRELADALPRLRGLHAFPSIYGHDAFLKEPGRLAPIIADCLKDAANV